MPHRPTTSVGRLVLTLATSGCLVVGEADIVRDAPVADDTKATVTTGTITDGTRTDTADTGSNETDGTTDGTTQTTDTTDTTEPKTPNLPVPLQGRYRRVDVSNVTDNCGFMTASLVGLSYEELYDFYLPNAARLQLEDDGFLWQEDDSGDYSLETEDPIRCDLEGTTFTCNNQDARQPTTYSQTLFSFYEIEVSGRVGAEDRLETDVTVTYLEFDTFSAAYLAAAGIDLGDCETSLTMRWVLQD